MPPTKRIDGPSAAASRQSTSVFADELRGNRPTPLLSSSIYQLTINTHHDTVGNLQNVVHFQADTESSGSIFATLNDLINAYLDATQDEFLACLANDMMLASYAARRITDGSPTITVAPLLTGLASGGVDNTGICVNIDLIPAVAPWNYGHFYVPGVPDTAMIGNFFQTSYTNKVDTFMSKLIGPMNHVGGSLGLTWHAVILQRKTQTARPIGLATRKPNPCALTKRLRPWTA